MTDRKGKEIATLTPQLFKEMVDAHQHGITIFQPCCTCGAQPAENLGLYIPNERISKLLGAPEGKTRTIGYSLCDRCYEVFDYSDVEAKLFKELNIKTGGV